MMTWSASSSFLRSGAKPPSSPTPVASFRLTSTFLSEWNTSAPIRSASANDSAPTGTIMNSWKSTVFVACAPPFRMFIIGTGMRSRERTAEVAIQRQPESPPPPRAPPPSRRRGSRSRRASPCSACRRARSAPGRSPPGRPRSMPRSAGAIVSSMFCTACLHALAEVPRRVAVAQLERLVLAGGCPARDRGAPDSPLASVTSASTVGLPRLSRISRAAISMIVDMRFRCDFESW